MQHLHTLSFYLILAGAKIRSVAEEKETKGFLLSFHSGVDGLGFFTEGRLPEVYNAEFETQQERDDFIQRYSTHPAAPCIC